VIVALDVITLVPTFELILLYNSVIIRTTSYEKSRDRSVNGKS
jgi:hypothetical protein